MSAFCSNRIILMTLGRGRLVYSVDMNRHNPHAVYRAECRAGEGRRGGEVQIFPLSVTVKFAYVMTCARFWVAVHSTIKQTGCNKQLNLLEIL